MAINSQLDDLSQVVHIILTKACELVQADHGSLVLIHPQNQSLEIVAVVGQDWTPEKQKCTLRLGQGITGQVAVSGKPYLCNDTSTDPFYFPLFPGVTSELAVPVISRGKLLGLINIDSFLPNAYSPADVEILCMLADHAAIALEKAHRFASEQSARQEWEQIFEAIHDGLIVCDERFDVQRVNRGFLSMFDFKPEQVLQRSASEVLKGLDFFQSGTGWWQRILQEGRGEQKARNPENGRSFLLSATHTTLNEQSVYLVTLRETTRQDELQEKVHQSEKLACLGQMIAGVAHELNNPLQTVIGFSELLSHTQGDERKGDQLRLIHQEAQRACRLVKTLLLFSRSQSPEMGDVPVNAFMERALDNWQKLYQTRSVELVLSLPEEHSYIMADRFQIEQVLYNLLNNAQQAMQNFRTRADAKIEVTASLTPQYVRLQVKDNGPGIQAEHLPRIFDPFFTTKKQGAGTGLGLAICYSIVIRHGGHIWCESEVGKGTSFLIEFARHRNVVRPVKPAIIQRTHLHNRRALVIDDEPTIGVLISEILRSENAQAESVTDAREALRLLELNRYDVIICDLKMPLMNGQQFYINVRQKHFKMATRVIFATGDLETEYKEFLQREGPFEIVNKPFDMEQLLDTVERVIASNEKPAFQLTAGRVSELVAVSSG